LSDGLLGLGVVAVVRALYVSVNTNMTATN
jgi:hypothetical protein